MKIAIAFVGATLMLSACDPVVPASEPLPFFGNGYRAEGDQCRRVGENDFTNQFLDDSADLVGCPADYEGLGVFVADTGGVQVGAVPGYVLFSVPH